MINTTAEIFDALIPPLKEMVREYYNQETDYRDTFPTAWTPTQGTDLRRNVDAMGIYKDNVSWVKAMQRMWDASDMAHRNHKYKLACRFEDEQKALLAMVNISRRNLGMEKKKDNDRNHGKPEARPWDHTPSTHVGNLAIPREDRDTAIGAAV